MQEKQKIVVCSYCTNRFEPYRPYQKYCSDKCREKAVGQRYKYRKKKEINKVCPDCGKRFVTVNPKKVYCTNICYLNHRARIYKPAEKEKRVCPKCGTQFESCHPNKKYCSKMCYILVNKERKTKNGV